MTEITGSINILTGPCECDLKGTLAKVVINFPNGEKFESASPQCFETKEEAIEAAKHFGIVLVETFSVSHPHRFVEKTDKPVPIFQQSNGMVH